MSNLNSTVSTSDRREELISEIEQHIRDIDALEISYNQRVHGKMVTLEMLAGALQSSTDSMMTFCMLDVTPESRKEALDDISRAEALDAAIKDATGMDSPATEELRTQSQMFAMRSAGATWEEIDCWLDTLKVKH